MRTPQKIEGTFAGYVEASKSGLKTLEGISIRKPNQNGEALGASGCSHLKEAKGSFPGYVNLIDTPIESVEELFIAAPNKNGTKASFQNCRNLHRLPKRILQEMAENPKAYQVSQELKARIATLRSLKEKNKEARNTIPQI